MHLADDLAAELHGAAVVQHLRLDAAADPAARLDEQHVGAGAREVAGARRAPRGPPPITITSARCIGGTLPEDVDRASGDEQHRDGRRRGLEQHQHLRLPAERHRVRRAERDRVREREVDVVEQARVPAGLRPAPGSPSAGTGSRAAAGSASTARTGPPRSKTQYQRPNAITFVLQIVIALYSSSPPFCSRRVTRLRSATPARRLPMPTRTNSASENSRRRPNWSICRRGHDSPSDANRIASGTSSSSHDHQGSRQSVQSCCRLTMAIATCITITTRTAGAASQRDSTSASCRFDPPTRASPASTGDRQRRDAASPTTPSRRRRSTAARCPASAPTCWCATSRGRSRSTATAWAPPSATWTTSSPRSCWAARR